MLLVTASLHLGDEPKGRLLSEALGNDELIAVLIHAKDGPGVGVGWRRFGFGGEVHGG